MKTAYLTSKDRKKPLDHIFYFAAGTGALGLFDD